MKAIILILFCLALGACSSTQKGFYDARLRYANPETGTSSIVPATVYVKNGKIKSIILDQE